MNDDKKVLFVCFTSYHLISSIYYSVTVDWGIRKRVLVFEQHLSQKIPESLISGFFDEIILIRTNEIRNKIQRMLYMQKEYGWLSGMSNQIKYAKQKGNIIIAFSDQNFLTYKMLKSNYDKNNNILVDEGLSTYTTASKRNKLITLKYAIFGFESTDYIGKSHLFNTWLVKEPNRLPDIKQINKKVIKTNNPFIDCNFISLFAGIQDLKKVLAKNNSILWLSGPTCELGVDEKKEVSILERIVKKYPNYHFIIKRHPREKAEKYSVITQNRNVTLIELGDWFWLPVELLANILRPRVILTVNSTAAKNLYYLGLETVVIYCYRLFPEMNFDISILDSFCKLTNFYNPCDYDDIISTIDNTEYITDQNVEENKNEDLRFLRLISKLTN